MDYRCGINEKDTNDIDYVRYRKKDGEIENKQAKSRCTSIWLILVLPVQHNLLGYS